MGNSCPSNCLYSCCDINYYCTTNTRNIFVSNVENCQYYYYDYTWVDWSVSIVVFFIFFFFFLWLFCCIRRRRNLALGTTQPMIVDNTLMTVRSPTTTNRQYMYDGNLNYNSNPQNYNGLQIYTNQPNYANAYNANNQYNRNYVQGNIFLYIKGEPIQTNQNQTYEMG